MPKREMHFTEGETVDNNITAAAWHESSHCVAAYALNLPCALVHIRDDGTGGAAIRTRDFKFTLQTWAARHWHCSWRQAIYAALAISIAGGVGERMFGNNSHGGDEIDLERIAVLADEHGISQHELAVLRRGVRQLLWRHQTKIRKLAAALFNNRWLSQLEIKNIMMEA